MFKVSFDIKVTIKDCPVSGLDCLDFRRKNGLPDDSTNEVLLKSEFFDEQTCRAFPKHIDDNCDLPVKRTGWGNSMVFGKFDANIAAISGPLEIPAEIVSRFLVKPDQNPVPMLSAIFSELCRHIAKREENIRERERLEQEAKAKRDEENAKYEQEKVRKKQERSDWIRDNGSELLEERLANGFEWENLFEQEFAEKIFFSLQLKEVSGFDGWDVDIFERNTPSLEEIRFLKLVQTLLSDKPAKAKLMWLKYEHEDTGEKSSQCELAVTVTCPTGREIIRYYNIG